MGFGASLELGSWLLDLFEHDCRPLKQALSSLPRAVILPSLPRVPFGPPQPLASPPPLFADRTRHRVRGLLGHCHACHRRRGQLRSPGANQEPRKPEHYRAQRQTARRAKSFRQGQPELRASVWPDISGRETHPGHDPGRDRRAAGPQYPRLCVEHQPPGGLRNRRHRSLVSTNAQPPGRCRTFLHRGGHGRKDQRLRARRRDGAGAVPA